MPPTLAAWEEVEAKFRSNGVAASGPPVRATTTQHQHDSGDEFVTLSHQLHSNMTLMSGPSSLPMSSDVSSTSNGGLCSLS